MFPQFGATAESLSRASALVFRIGTDAGLYDDPDDVNIAPLLDSRFDSDRAQALKRLLSLLAQGVDVSNFFPQVVKNVASSSLEMKKLVYVYLLHYAEKRQNEALLSINCFQKDLSDINPLVRAWALRAMAGIRLHVVAPLVLMAITKCAKDPSAYVRKCAANAIPKLYDVHQEGSEALEKLIFDLLSDHSPGVVGAAAAAFNSVCPNNLSLIGIKFRGLCEILPDVEEWGQIPLIDILLRFLIATHGLVRESFMFSSGDEAGLPLNKKLTDLHLDSDYPGTDISVGHETSTAKLNTLLFKWYMEGQEEYLSRSGSKSGDYYTLGNSLSTSSQNCDVRLLLKCTSPLFWSRNCAVVFAAAGVHWIMAPRSEVDRIVKPVLFLLRSSPDSKFVVLCNIQVFSKVVPELFAPYFEDFFICSSDSYRIKALKLEILSNIAIESTISVIFEEFQDYVYDVDRKFVADTVSVIGICAQRLPSVADSCIEALLALVVQRPFICNCNLDEDDAGVLVQAIMSIKSIIKESPNAHEKTILRLAQNLEDIKEPVTRSLIIWIIGEYHSTGDIISKAVPIVLKYLAWGFTSEATVTKLQILNSAAKVVRNTEGEDLVMFKQIMNYILELAKCDSSYDIRDRARVMDKLLFHCLDGSFDPKKDKTIYSDFVESLFGKNTQKSSPSISNWRFYLPGSLSQVVQHSSPGYSPLPKPCSLRNNNEAPLDMSNLETMNSGDYSESEDSGVMSGDSLREDSNSDSEPFDDPELARKSNEDVTASSFEPRVTEGNNEVPLILVSHDGYDQTVCHLENNSESFSGDLGELMSKSALESWLNEQPNSLPSQSSGKLSAPRITVYELDLDIKPKVHTLLDPINGHGLKIEYIFTSEISNASPYLTCVELSFGNSSDEPLTQIALKDEEPEGNAEHTLKIEKYHESSMSAEIIPNILETGNIMSLDPGQIVKKVIQVHFHHHLLPLKLTVIYNDKMQSTKLWPEIGYFMRPLPMDVDAFVQKESQLPGMFEYYKRFTFKDHIKDHAHQASHTDKFLVICRILASKVLSNTNLHLVCVDVPVSSNTEDISGTCLRFSGEILSSSTVCLISIVLEGDCCGPLEVSVKINCEETIFGLNLLNRLVALLQ